MADELISGHLGGMPGGLKAGVPVKPFVARLMIKLMAPRIL